MATLNLPTSPRTGVFRAIDQILRNDPVLKSLFDTFISWQGDPQDGRELTKTNAPAIRITPANGPETWKFPESFTGKLYINYELIVDGFDYDDLLNVQWAIERAIYPADDSAKQAIVATLQQAGAYTGLIEFSNPAFDPNPESNFFVARGQLMLDVRAQIT